MTVYQYTSLDGRDGNGYKREHQELIQFLALFVAGSDVRTSRVAIVVS
jgi:hypothetical protein